jgi:hypothetical protein
MEQRISLVTLGVDDLAHTGELDGIVLAQNLRSEKEVDDLLEDDGSLVLPDFSAG